MIRALLFGISFVLLPGLFSLAPHSRVQAQDRFEVLDWQGELTWNKHLIQQMHAQYAEREDKFWEAVTSEKGARAYREKIEARYEEMLGSFPAESPLNETVTGTIQRDGYRIEKLIYESFPDHHVTANLYVPSGAGPFPGILFFCGHEREAKATASYQRTAMLLAKNGFVVLVIDPISQGERFQLTDDEGMPLTRGGTTTHTLLSASSNLVGTDVVNYEYWDNKRGLDYLLSRPEVNEDKIGAIGNSGGATMVTYFMGLNETVDVEVLSSYVTKRSRSMEVLGPQDGCQWLPYEGANGLEIVDFLLMKAPVPTLTLAGRYDFVDFVGTRRSQDEMDGFYAALGQPDKTKLYTKQDGHGISKPKREESVEWFRQWFYDDTTNVTEGSLDVLSEEQLQSTETGQVNASFDEYNIQERNVDLAEELAAERAQFKESHGRDEYAAKIMELLGIDISDRAEVKTEVVGSIEIGGHRYEKVILRRKGMVPIPALVLPPSDPSSMSETVLWLSDIGKKFVATERQEQLAEYAEAGTGVVIADVRGTGETQDPAEYNNEKYYNRQYRNDQISLHIGTPVVGQRVQDVMTILDFVSTSDDLRDEQIDIRATGIVASPVLHAALFDSRIDDLRLSETIDSYMDILQNPLGKDWYAYVVPNALQYYDLPDLVARVGTETVEYHEMRDLSR